MRSKFCQINLKRLVVTLCCAAILFVSVVDAKTLKEYREEIAHLRNDFSAMLFRSDGAEKIEAEVFKEAAEFLAKIDTVEVEGKSVPVDNEWLAKKISAYKNAEKGSDRKRSILLEIYERLLAIETKLTELENSTAKPTKDANKRKIAEILRREEYQKPTGNEESLVQGLIRRFLEWLRGLAPEATPQPASNTGFPRLAYVLQILLYGLVIAALAFLLYKFAPLIFERLARNKQSKREARIVLGERLSPAETPHTLFSEAERLAREGNLKAAIRKGYIALLFELSERKVLGLAKHKTNRDYLREVTKKTELHKDMTGLTQNYERHWYGFDTVDEGDWEEFRSGYERAIGSK